MNDTQHSLGKLIEGDALRDAVHIAVAPVTANEKLSPGDDVGPVVGDAETMGRSANPIGIVDPFLNRKVFPGDRFWLFLYPNTITSLRHAWTHPAFPDQKAGVVSESVNWLTLFAGHFGMNYDQLMEVMREYNATGDEYCLGDDTPDVAYTQSAEAWKHFEKVTGEKPQNGTGSVFRCAC